MLEQSRRRFRRKLTRIGFGNRAGFDCFSADVSRIKVRISEVKAALGVYGIDGFVAHDDIEPTVQWHREIELALRSMDMLCAFVTEDFTGSKWCDQEGGFALGRPVPVIAVRCGADPYGLLGKDQALTADISKPKDCAVRIVDIVARQDHLRTRLMDGLVEGVAGAISFQDAKDSSKLVLALKSHLTDTQIVRLLEGSRDNSQVREATGVPERIRANCAGARSRVARKGRDIGLRRRHPVLEPGAVLRSLTHQSECASLACFRTWVRGARVVAHQFRNGTFVFETTMSGYFRAFTNCLTLFSMSFMWGFDPIFTATRAHLSVSLIGNS